MVKSSNVFLDSFSKDGAGVTTLVELLRARARSQPDRAAYTYLVDGETEEVKLTYADLDLRARLIASALQRSGARGERALLLYPPGLDFIAGFFGCLYAGAVAVPAYPPDPAKLSRSLPRLRAIAVDAQPAVVLTTSQVLSMAGLIFKESPELKGLNWIATDALAGGDDGWLAPDVASDDLAFLQYTSGSTGTPKGVMLTHGNLLYNASLVYYAFGHTPEEKYVSWLPTFHDMGFMAGVLQPLSSGFEVILMSPLAFLQRPVRWLQAISKYGATTSGGPNFAFDLCVHRVKAEDKAKLDLSSWTVAFNGSEPVRAESLDRFAAGFASCGFNREALYPCYGLAEATLIVAGGAKHDPPVVKRVRAKELENGHAVGAATDDKAARLLVGCGKTLPGQDILIVNPESQTECAPSEVGEVWVSGPSIAQGYWNRLEETESMFRARVSGRNDRVFLRTGDQGFLRDGELFITGRIKDLIIIRGLNHYPQDIELTAERCHRALRPGCGAAFSVESGGEERLVIVQEIDDSQPPDMSQIVETIRRAVSEQHELQVYGVALIKPGSIWKTSSGKIQRHACKAAYLNGTLTPIFEWQDDLTTETEQSGSEVEQAGSYAAPSSQTIESLRAWLVNYLSASTGVEASKVDVNDSLSQFNLDSLKAVELAHSIESDLGIRMPMERILQDLSISDLAAEAFDLLNQPPLEIIHAGARGTDDEFPLSYGQKGIWFLQQFDPESTAYNIIVAVRIRAALDAVSFKKAFQALVDRHACLRTTFSVREGEPVQVIHESMGLCFKEQDASSWGEAGLQETLVEQAYQPFDLEQGPLLRVGLFTRSPEEAVVLLVLHHATADLWSLAVLMKELAILYQAEKAGAPTALPPLTLEYTDYVRWQAEMLAGAEGENSWNYWKEQLAGDLPGLELPIDRPRPLIQDYRGSSKSFDLSADLTRGLKALSQAQNATLYMVLLAGFQVLLHRYTGQQDILVGSPTAGRRRAAMSGMVGYLVNPVVLRADLSRLPKLGAFLQQVRRTVLSALEHQDYPFALLVERLQPARDPGRSPIFQAMFALENARIMDIDGVGAFALGESGAHIRLGELLFESLPLEQKVTQFDLTLMMSEVDGRLVGSLQYDTDLFDPETIERMARHYVRVLEAMASDLEQKVYEVGLLTGQEREQVITQWNDTRREYPARLSIQEMFEQQVRQTPTAIAVVGEQQQLTYEEVNRRANQLGDYLRSIGVGAEVIVGVSLPRSADLVVALLGILKAGGAYAPLDPSYPTQRLAFMIEDLQASVIVSEEHLLEKVPATHARIVCLDRDRDKITERNESNLAGGVSPSNLAYVLYTSGSTGKPKGVAIEHRSAVAFLHWARDVFYESDGVLAATSINFDLSVFELFAPLSWGGKVIVADNALHLASLRTGGQVSLINTVPSAIAELIRMDALPDTIRTVNLAGEPLPGSLVEKIYQQPHVTQLNNLYGPSETTTYSTHSVIKKTPNGPVMIGRPIANTEVYVLDERLQAAPVGVYGELYIAGAGLARGYLNRPEQTAERFVPKPFGQGAGERMYRTGDRVRWTASGELEFAGRIDQQVKIRGYRIELGEIEAAINQHPRVRESLVLMKEDVPGEKQLVAYVVADKGEILEIDELRFLLRSKLPEYMMPARFVTLDSLPLTPSGKVDKLALRKPDFNPARQEATFEMPETPTEKEIAQIWNDILLVEKIGVQDNFFDLGGHSLLASRLLSRIESEFGVKPTLKDFYTHPNIRSLSEMVEAAILEQADSAKFNELLSLLESTNDDDAQNLLN